MHMHVIQLNVSIEQLMKYISECVPRKPQCIASPVFTVSVFTNVTIQI